jgi:predicted acyltransferase
MVFVERLPGLDHPLLRHAPWEGLTLADIVFPAFLVVLGASLALSLARQVPVANRIPRLLRRLAALMVLGLAYDAISGDGFDLSQLRWPGVLQRIAVAGFVGAVIVLALRRRLLAVLIAALMLLVSYGLVLDHRTPGCSDHPTIAAPACSWPGQLDLELIDARHLYGLGALGYDPEGIASTTGAVASVLLGWVAGEILRRDQRWRTVGVLLAGAAVAVLVAWAWHMAVIKRIWTPPFALVTAGITTAALAAVVAMADVVDRRPLWARRAGRGLTWPAVTLGRNALVLYVGQHAAGTALQRNTTADGTTLETRLLDVVANGSSIVFAILAVLACLAVASLLRWRRWYVTV